MLLLATLGYIVTICFSWHLPLVVKSPSGNKLLDFSLDVVQKPFFLYKIKIKGQEVSYVKPPNPPDVVFNVLTEPTVNH